MKKEFFCVLSFIVAHSFILYSMEEQIEKKDIFSFKDYFSPGSWGSHFDDVMQHALNEAKQSDNFSYQKKCDKKNNSEKKIVFPNIKKKRTLERRQRILELTISQYTNLLTWNKKDVSYFEFILDDKRLVIKDQNDVLRVIETEKERIIFQDGNVFWLRVDPTGNKIAIRYQDVNNSLKIKNWDGKEIFEDFDTSWQYPTRFSHNGEIATIYYLEGGIQNINVVTGKLVRAAKKWWNRGLNLKQKKSKIWYKNGAIKVLDKRNNSAAIINASEIGRFPFTIDGKLIVVNKGSDECTISERLG